MSVTVLNTTASLSGKTLVTAENDVTVTGLMTFDRDPSAPFAVSASSAVVTNLDADKLDGLEASAFAKLGTANAGNLIFTDATYDIGASGATRPRDLFLSRNATIGGTIAVTGAATFDGAVTLGNAAGDAITSTGTLTITPQATMTAGFKTTSGNCYIGDTANANMTLGLTINQGAADDAILAFKSSDVGHGATSVVEADTYCDGRKFSATDGGFQLTGISEANNALTLIGLGATQETGKTTSDVGAVNISGRSTSGGAAANLGADGNILAVRNNTTTRFILDGDGDSHQDVGVSWTNFDDGDDLARLQAVAVTLAREGDPLREEFVKSFEQHRDVIESMPGKPLVTFNPDGHHFVNMSRLAMLHTGAIRQLAEALTLEIERNDLLQARLAALEQKLLN